jgi:hypothetical protein
VALLHEIADAEQRQPAEDQDRDQQDVEDLAVGDAEADQERGDDRTKVSTIKRGENGISRVSMTPSSKGPRVDFGALLFSSATITSSHRNDGV